MSDSTILPGVRAALIARDGTTSPEFYRFFRALSVTAELPARVDDLTVRVVALEKGHGNIGNVQGKQSIVSQGILSNGLVILYLDGDVDIAPELSFYGALLQGSKGWQSFSANFEALANDDDTYSLDLADLANSGVGTLQAVTVDAKGRVSGYRDATITGTDGRITVDHGDASDGLPTIDLATVADAGGGTLQRTAFDAYGRKTGTSAATTSDLTEGTNLYFTAARSDARITLQKGQPLGLPTLDAGGKLDTGQLPALAITETFVVADEAAMLALTAEQGDVAVRTDLSKSFILTTNDPTVLANWQDLLTPTSPVTSVFGRVGSVTAASGDYTFAQIADTPTTLGGYGITDAATSAQGALADTALQPGAIIPADDVSGLATVATTGSYDDLADKPSIPAEQVNADWTASSGVEEILNKPTLGTAAAADVGDFDAAGAASSALTSANSYTDAGLATKEPAIAAGTTAQYRRGDKTWQALNKAAVGLGNVDNTSDANKPVSTAQAAADALRVLKAGDTMTGPLVLPDDPDAALQAAPKQYVDRIASSPVPVASTVTAEQFLVATGGETGAPLTIAGLPLDGASTVSAIHRTDWQGRQLIYATARTNHITDSGFLTTAGSGAATTAPFAGVTGTTQGLHLPGGVVGYSYYSLAKIPGVATFSVFVRMDDGGTPVPGDSNLSSYDFSMRVWGGTLGGIDLSTLIVANLGGGLYKCSVKARADSTGSFTGVYKYATNSARGVTITGYQLEIDTSGSYIPTTTAPATVTDYALSGADVSLGQAATAGATYDWDGTGYPKRPAAFNGPVRIGQYTLAALPDASTYDGSMIRVTDATGGPALCMSDGTDWINVNTNAAVS